MILRLFTDGGRYKMRTCDPLDVNEVPLFTLKTGPPTLKPAVQIAPFFEQRSAVISRRNYTRMIKSWSTDLPQS